MCLVYLVFLEQPESYPLIVDAGMGNISKLRFSELMVKRKNVLYVNVWWRKILDLHYLCTSINVYHSIRWLVLVKLVKGNIWRFYDCPTWSILGCPLSCARELKAVERNSKVRGKTFVVLRRRSFIFSLGAEDEIWGLFCVGESIVATKIANIVVMKSGWQAKRAKRKFVPKVLNSTVCVVKKLFE